MSADQYYLKEKGNFGTIALTIGLVGLALSCIGYFVDQKQFFFSYLVGFAYWTTLGLGSLFFILLHHLVSATWSIVIRRIVENLALTLPVMAIFMIPLFFGLHDLFHWSHAEVVAADPILQGKEPYLNSTFFIIRGCLYFVVWFILSFLLYRNSIDEDKNGYTNKRTSIFHRISAPGMILFALSSTFAAFDWLMSLDAHWFSTIFGVYVFAGGFLSFLSLMAILIISFRKRKVLEGVLSVEHLHDVLRLAFGFTVFWAYMAFSQYMLIWYANVPEETVWFLDRWEGSWKIMSMVVLFGHFVVPFLVLLTRANKRRAGVALSIALWLLVMHFIDIYWIVMPNFQHHGFHFSWMDITCVVGIGGIFLWVFWTRLTRTALVPINDPRLEKSINIVN